jgi:type II secretory pathway pseudopilin PulG
LVRFGEIKHCLETGSVFLYSKIMKGFSLVEIMTVVGVAAILGVGLIVVINPLERINQTNDAAAIKAMNELATAIRSYAISTGGYPNAASYGLLMNRLLTAGEITTAPDLPAGYSGYVAYSGTTSPVSGHLTMKLLSGHSRTSAGCMGATPEAYYVFDVSNGKSCLRCSTDVSAPLGACP